jgi:hypothetical protein
MSARELMNRKEMCLKVCIIQQTSAVTIKCLDMEDFTMPGYGLTSKARQLANMFFMSCNTYWNGEQLLLH